MNKYDGIIFDWAGTTIDFGCMAPVEAFLRAFKKHGIEPTLDEIREPMGMLKIDHIRTIFQMERISNIWEGVHSREWSEDDVVQVYKESEKILFENLHSFVDIKPHVLEVMEVLKEKGIKIGSTTGYTKEMMEIVLPIAKEGGYYPDSLVTPTDVQGYGRPYPYMVFKNMENLGIASVDKVLKIGDTVSDIKEGKAAGVKTAGIIIGSSIMGLSKKEYDALNEVEKERTMAKVRKTYEEAGTDYIFNDIRGLLEIIK